MINTELMAKLLEEKTWQGVEAIDLNNCTEIECGERSGLPLVFQEGDVLEFPNETKMKIFVKEFKGSKVLYTSLLRNGERLEHVPLSIFRRIPASSWEKYQEEVDTSYNPSVNPLGSKLVNRSFCGNDLDRARLLAKAGKVLVGKEFKIHCQRFKEGKPQESWYEMRAWTYSALEK